MLFSSISFLYFFLPVFMLIYVSVKMKAKNIVLLVAGVLFYAWGEPIYVFIMLISTGMDYFVGVAINKYDSDEILRKMFLIVSLFMNLSLLFVFRYYSSIITDINSVFNLNIYNPNLPIPLGISFYVLQRLSYIIDLYFRKTKVSDSFINFATYSILFPVVIAGPILRYDDIKNEIYVRQVSATKISDGIAMFVKGLGKKVLIADQIGLVWAAVKTMDSSNISVLTAWIGIISFAFQIYFDFSGYSDMAVGIGKMLGFSIPQNFNYPYTAKSVGDFCKRWHITLVSWFKTYVYLPLGGSTNGKITAVRNFIIVCAAIGLWHGAGFNLILWGLYFAAILIVEKLLLGNKLVNIPSFVGRIYTFVLVVIGWAIFSADSLSGAFRFIVAMFGGTKKLFDSEGIYLLTCNLFIIIISIFGATGLVKKGYNKMVTYKVSIMSYVMPVLQGLVLIASTACLISTGASPFIINWF